VPTPENTWEYDDRFYAVTAVSGTGTRDGFGWELDDVAPAPGHGPVLEAFWDDGAGRFTFTSFTPDPLPFALVERFVREANQAVPPPAEA
jgi:hypothetical protein